MKEQTKTAMENELKWMKENKVKKNNMRRLIVELALEELKGEELNNRLERLKKVAQ